MIKKIDGIVVKEIAYKDTSKIIEVLTKDGIYSIVAKGAKKVSSPLFLGICLLPVCCRLSTIPTIRVVCRVPLC